MTPHISAADFVWCETDGFRTTREVIDKIPL